MKSPQPTLQEIDELVAFLPRLYATGFTPFEEQQSEAEGQVGAASYPWPRYNTVVGDFYRAAAGECWCDFEYNPRETARMLQDEAAVKTASLAQIKTMITYCVRGERFCDGHWGAMIEQGHIRRLLERLAKIRSEPSDA